GPVFGHAAHVVKKLVLRVGSEIGIGNFLVAEVRHQCPQVVDAVVDAPKCAGRESAVSARFLLRRAFEHQDGNAVLGSGVCGTECGIAGANDYDIGGAREFDRGGAIHRGKPDIRKGGSVCVHPHMSTRRPGALGEFSHIVKWFPTRVELNVGIEVDAAAVEARGKGMSGGIVIAGIFAAILGYLVFPGGAFWRASVRDDTSVAGISAPWPAVAAVIPARNESECIARSVRSLLQQDYRGPINIVVVDDDSDDDTGMIATDAAAGDKRLRV